MRVKMLVLIAALGSLSASAQAMPLQGYISTISGRAHVEEEADGTYVFLGNAGSIAGFVPFDDRSTLPQLAQLDGRDVQITGVVDGKLQITITDPDQIKVTD